MRPLLLVGGLEHCSFEKHRQQIVHSHQCPRMVRYNSPEIIISIITKVNTCLPNQVVALHDVSSTDAAIIYTMEPVLGAGLAYVVLGERWGSLGWLGAALIIASSLAAQIVGTEEEVTPEQPKSKQLKGSRR
jgi:hypothetical protein